MSGTRNSWRSGQSGGKDDEHKEEDETHLIEQKTAETAPSGGGGYNPSAAQLRRAPHAYPALPWNVAEPPMLIDEDGDVDAQEAYWDNYYANLNQDGAVAGGGGGVGLFGEMLNTHSPAFLSSLINVPPKPKMKKMKPMSTLEMGNLVDFFNNDYDYDDDDDDDDMTSDDEPPILQIPVGAQPSTAEVDAEEAMAILKAENKNKAGGRRRKRRKSRKKKRKKSRKKKRKKSRKKKRKKSRKKKRKSRSTRKTRRR